MNTTMAKQAKSTDNEYNEFFAVPDDGLVVQADDIAGYWDPDKSEIRCIPRSVKLFDNTQDKTRASALIYCEATTKCLVKNRDDDGNAKYRVVEKGTMVGIWYKPGMRPLENMAGVEVHIKKTDKTVDTGKALPMVIFEVKGSAERKPIPVTEDRRDRSRGHKTPFDRDQPKSELPAQKEETDNIPF